MSEKQLLPEEDKTILSDQMEDIVILEAEYIEGEDFKTKLTIV